MPRALLRCVFAALALCASSVASAQPRPGAGPNATTARTVGPGRLALAAAQSAIDEVILPEDMRPRLCQALMMLRNKRDELPPKKHGNIPL